MFKGNYFGPEYLAECRRFLSCNDTHLLHLHSINQLFDFTPLLSAGNIGPIISFTVSLSSLILTLKLFLIKICYFYWIVGSIVCCFYVEMLDHVDFVEKPHCYLIGVWVGSFWKYLFAVKVIILTVNCLIC